MKKLYIGIVELRSKGRKNKMNNKTETRVSPVLAKDPAEAQGLVGMALAKQGIPFPDIISIGFSEVTEDVIRKAYSELEESE